METQHDVMIIGCGWLGLPLAKHWIAKGLSVAGTTTHAEKLQTLSAAGVAAYLVQLDDATPVQLVPVLRSKTVVVAVPPRLRHHQPEQYLRQMRKVALALDSSTAEQVIFISSTSVYPDAGSVCTEHTPFDEQSPLVKAEELFPKTKTAVVRFGGLVGPARHPGRFFSGKSSIPNGRAPVNLIHLQDCLAAIDLIRQKKLTGVFNGVAPSHPQKQVFYTEAARHYNLLTPPSFIDELNEWKQVEPKNLRKTGFVFQHPDLMHALQQNIW